MSLDRYQIIGPLAYRGKKGCQSALCTRHSGYPDTCYGWHCSYCDEPCSSQGHNCDVARTFLDESRRILEDET